MILRCCMVSGAPGEQLLTPVTSTNAGPRQQEPAPALQPPTPPVTCPHTGQEVSGTAITRREGRAGGGRNEEIEGVKNRRRRRGVERDTNMQGKKLEDYNMQLLLHSAMVGGILCDPLCHHLTPDSSRSMSDGPAGTVRQISMIKCDVFDLDSCITSVVVTFSAAKHKKHN
ncbi:hypothetical protein L3Q82_005796 [Scortum barcoo]|uniref:Uncharacterized protein n=1 Tax=Scortum barcoo TaxID=214431 RepID=A0ACB8V6I7_9TELE|nr:hypothetical protein L3Q82_005796 [Scortum barcoo]